MLKQHGDRTALPHYRGHRLETCFIRHGVEIHYHSGSLQAVLIDLLPAAAGSDLQGVQCDQCDAQTHPTCPLSKNKIRCGRAAQDAPLHLPPRVAWSTSPADSAGSRDLPP